MRRSSLPAVLPGLRRLPAVLALAVAFTGLAVAPSTASVSCTAYWTGHSSTTWEDPANWSDHADSDGTDSHAAPGVGDVACMATNPTTHHLVASSGLSVGALRFGEADDLTVIGPLTVGTVGGSTTGSVTTDGPLTKTAGSTLDVLGAFPQGGTLVAYGRVNLHGASSLQHDITGDVHNVGTADIVDGSYLTFAGLVNDGTITVNGYAEVYPDGANPSIVNNGTIVGGTANAAVNAYLPRIDNQGVIRSTNGWLNVAAPTNLWDGVLHGSGTLDADGGILYFGGEGLSGNEATLRLGPGGDFYDELSFLTSNSGTLDVGQDLSVGDNLVNTGTVKVGAQLTAPGYTQTAGSTVGAGGKIVGSASVTGGSIGGPLEVSGDLTLGPAATTKVVVHGPANSEYVRVDGASSIAGTLDVTTDPAYTPVDGDYYDAVPSNGGASGTFDTVNGDQPTVYYRPRYSDTGVLLMAVSQEAYSVSADAPVVSESAGSASFTLHRSGYRDAPMTVDWETRDGSAHAGEDYVASHGTVTFGFGHLDETVTVPVTDTAVVDGRRSFSVVLSNPVHGQLSSTQASAAQVVTNDDAPVVSSVVGGPVPQGATNQLLTVHGVGFRDATDVSFSRSGLKVVAGSLHVVDDGSLTVRVAAASTMATGPIVVRVAIPDAAAGSCGDCLSVVSRPVVASTTPGVLGAGASHQTVTVSGSGFVDGAAVTVAGAVVHSTTFVSATQLQVSFSVPASRAPGVALVKVTNPDGGTSTCRTCASFVAGPHLDSVPGIAGRRSLSQTVHLSGSGFVDGLTLSGPAGVSFTDLVVSPSGITATMTVASTTRVAAGQKITVTNPASAGWGASTAAPLTVCTKYATSCG